MKSAKATTSILATLAALFLCLPSLVSGGNAQEKGSKPSPPPTPPVTSTIYDYSDPSANTQPVLLRSDDYNAVGKATYADSNGVISEIFTPYWLLDLSGQKLRTVYVTFSNHWMPASGGPNTSPVPDGYFDAHVISRCYDVNNVIVSFLQISVDTSNNRCSLRIELTNSGTQYLFVMAPILPGTGWSTVSCIAANSSGCSSWTIIPNTTTPSSQGNYQLVANLYTVNSKNGKNTLIGSAHNTYRIEATE